MHSCDCLRTLDLGVVHSCIPRLVQLLVVTASSRSPPVECEVPFGLLLVRCPVSCKALIWLSSVAAASAVNCGRYNTTVCPDSVDCSARCMGFLVCFPPFLPRAGDRGFFAPSSQSPPAVCKVPLRLLLVRCPVSCKVVVWLSSVAAASAVPATDPDGACFMCPPAGPFPAKSPGPRSGSASTAALLEIVPRRPGLFLPR